MAVQTSSAPDHQASPKALLALWVAFWISLPLGVIAGSKFVTARTSNYDFNCLTAAPTWASSQAAIAAVATALLLAAAVFARRGERADRRSGWPSPSRECFALAVLAWTAWVGVLALDPRRGIPQPACGGL